MAQHNPNPAPIAIEVTVSALGGEASDFVVVTYFLSFRTFHMRVLKTTTPD